MISVSTFTTRPPIVSFGMGLGVAWLTNLVGVFLYVSHFAIFLPLRIPCGVLCLLDPRLQLLHWEIFLLQKL